MACGDRAMSVLDENVISDRIIFLMDEEYWGDEGDDYDIVSITTQNYIVLTIENNNPVTRILKIIRKHDDWNRTETFDVKLGKPQSKFSFSQLITLHPKLIERFVLLLGGYEPLIKLI